MTYKPTREFSEKAIDDAHENVSDFEQAALHSRANLAGDVWHFLQDNKKWWLLPILVLLLLFGGLILLSGTAVAPFIYTLF